MVATVGRDLVMVENHQLCLQSNGRWYALRLTDVIRVAELT
jgi:hypothetical protein